MIDIDCVEYDPKTSEPVRIAETVRTWTGKPTTVLRNIARKLNVEAWLIVYFLQPTEDGNDLTIGFFEAKIVYPSEGKLQRYSAEEFAKFWVESFDALCAKARGETAR